MGSSIMKTTAAFLLFATATLTSGCADLLRVSANDGEKVSITHQIDFSVEFLAPLAEKGCKEAGKTQATYLLTVKSNFATSISTWRCT